MTKKQIFHEQQTKLDTRWRTATKVFRIGHKQSAHAILAIPRRQQTPPDSNAGPSTTPPNPVPQLGLGGTSRASTPRRSRLAAGRMEHQTAAAEESTRSSSSLVSGA